MTKTERVVRGVQGALYRLHEQIGEGGTALIYRATRSGGSDVAIKSLLPGHQPKSRARFLRELKIAASLSHPALIRVLDHGEDTELGPFMVMPLIQGSTLRELFTGRRLSPEAVLVLLHPLLDALSMMHSAALVHRDLKPENIMLTPEGTLTLVDLGLTLGPDQTRLTEEGMVAGSVPYMSPEQIEGGEITPPSDVWSIAVMAYEWLVGARPFARVRASEEVAAILGGAHEPLSEADRRCSEHLSVVFERCLQREPSARPSTAGALWNELADCVDWSTEQGLTTELQALAANIGDFERAIMTMRTARLRSDAVAAISQSDGFAALRILDRALAYEPENPESLELIEEATRASAGQDQPALTGTGERAVLTGEGSTTAPSTQAVRDPLQDERKRGPQSPVPRALVIAASILLFTIGVIVLAVVAGFASCAMACFNCSSGTRETPTAQPVQLTAGPAPPTAAELASSLSPVEIEVGANHACAIVDGGLLYCWGLNNRGQLGDGSSRDQATPIVVQGLEDPVEVAVGERFTCARTRDGSVRCWGDGSSGQLGNGQRNGSPVPAPVSGLPPIVELDAGHNHICGLADDGTVFCWGESLFGQCGPRDGMHQTTPRRIEGLNHVTSIEAGRSHSCAVKRDETVWCWGGNRDGRLGFGGRFAHSDPVRVANIENATAVSVGSDHTCALTSDGRVRCWGNGERGQLGGSHSSNVPLSLPLRDVRSIESGGSSSCALHNDGRISCWGSNEYDFLADGFGEQLTPPSEISSMRAARSVALGGTFRCALAADRALSCQGLLGPRHDGRPAIIYWPTQARIAFHPPQNWSPPVRQPPPTIDGGTGDADMDSR